MNLNKNSLNKVRAYWIGVGMHASFKKQNAYLLTGKYGRDIDRGWKDAKSKDVAKKFR